MAKYVKKMVSLDKRTNALLRKLAELDAQPEWGETPNESGTLRKMIVERADSLGVVVVPPDKNKKDKRPA